MSLLLDTSVLVSYVRNSDFKDHIDEVYQPFANGKRSIISHVTVGELHALSLKQNWGKNRWRILDGILQNLLIVDQGFDQLYQTYAELDAYAEGKHPRFSVGRSSNTVGKNDLWIAATAVCYNTALLTVDKDFLIFDPDFLSVSYLDLQDIF